MLSAHDRLPGSPPEAQDKPLEETPSSAPPTRSKRPRHTTSVTDKSEWITGDEQIDSVISEHLSEERRAEHNKARALDPELDRYVSSDNSSNNASDDSDDQDSEDDPDRLWCICQQPYDGKFMIQCDVCQDWFHGQCVGIPKLRGDRMTKEGKEWFCSECSDKMRSGIPRASIPLKVSKKEKKKRHAVPSKRGPGRPKKSETILPTRASQKATKRSSVSHRTSTRSESFDEIEDGQKLKELIRERRKEFFYKRDLATQQKQAKRHALGFGRQSLTACLSDSLDSLASSTSTPNMSNLPINIKSEHREHKSKPNIVLQINTKKDSNSDPGNSRIVTAIVKERSSKKKHSVEQQESNVNDLFTADPIQIPKRNPGTSDQTVSNSDLNADTPVRKRSNSKSDPSDNVAKKKRKDSESTPNGSVSSEGSKHCIQKLKSCLMTRSKQIEDVDMSAEQIEKLAQKIEFQLNENFRGTQKYMHRFQSLLFNLNDPKNKGFVKNVLSGEIPPSKLVKMSSDEMASHELAEWRERENKHSIELIKRDAEMAAQQVIVKKTHKGEEVISTRSLNDSDEITREKSEPSGSSKQNEANTDDAVRPSKPARKTSGSASTESSGNGRTTSPSLIDSLAFLDTTKEHKNHIFDMNCKVCTKQQTEEEADLEASLPLKKEDDKPVEFSETVTPDANQPKRLRVSFDSKLDTSNLSRPLGRPLLEPSGSDSGLHSPSRTPPFEAAVDEPEATEAADAYDPELFPAMSKQENSLECWSGSITMPTFAKFSATAKSLSGPLSFLKCDISRDLMVCGRIAPDQVHGYIKKLRTTSKNQIFGIQLFPASEDDKKDFESFSDCLYGRNRYGVIETSEALKDFYLIPLHKKSNVPEVLKPSVKETDLDRSDETILLGLLVRSKRNSPASYTPTPLK